MIENQLFSHKAEQAVIGAILQDRGVAEKITLSMRPEEFYEHRHQVIFRAMQILAISKTPIDLVSVTEYIEKHSKLTAEGIAYISDCMVSVPSTANTDYYAHIVKDYALRRALLCKAGEIEKIACNMDKSDEEAYCDVLAAIESVKPDGQTGVDESLQAIMRDTYLHIGERQDGHGMGMETGIATFDKATGGLYGGELTVIGARPGIGKSAIAQQIAMGFAKRGKTVQFFSLEMSEEQYGIRAFSYGTGVSAMKMRTGQIEDGEFKSFREAMEEFREYPLFINTAARTPLQMRMACKNRGNVDLVVVDYMQLVRPNGKYGNREQEVAAVSRAFKELSLELNIPIVVLSQLNRDADGKEPSMRDLRESGAIEQDADNIILLHEPVKWADPEEQQLMLDCLGRGDRLIKVMVIKQRQGAQCYFNLVFEPKHMMYISLMKDA